MTVFSYLFVSLFCFCVCVFFCFFLVCLLCLLGAVFFSFHIISWSWILIQPNPHWFFFLFVFIQSRIEQELMARMISELNSRHEATNQPRDPARASSPDDSIMSADSSQTSMGEPTIIYLFICLLACLLVGLTLH